MKDWAEIHPAKGEEKDTIVLLLSLAEHPTHVRSQLPESHLLVPPYLADLYEEATRPKPRRGRPKKEKEEEQ